MTKKEFKRAMQCGLGRCILELQDKKNLERFKDIVLWGCTHELSFDAQCEGTRAWYLYQMILCYEDIEPFIDAIMICGDKCIAKSTWLWMQCIEILGFFAADGNVLAQNTLNAYYEKLYAVLMKRRKRRENGTLPELDNFEELCIVMVDTADTKEDYLETYLQIVSDIGNLMIANKLFDFYGFDWFQHTCEAELGEKRLNHILVKKSKHSVAIQKYLEMQRNSMHEIIQNQEIRKRDSINAQKIYDCIQNGGIVGRNLPIMIASRLAKEEGKLELLQLETYYREETDIRIRVQLLHLLANKFCASVMDATTVIQDSLSEDGELRKYAFQALSYMKDKKVREYALEKLKGWNSLNDIYELYQTNCYFEDFVAMLANNCQTEDYDCLVSVVKAVPVTYGDEYGWHAIYISIRNMFLESNAKNSPKELLLHMYSNSLCSYCREIFVEEMDRRRMLTEEILQECLYDSNEEIREFAKKLTT